MNTTNHEGDTINHEEDIIQSHSTTKLKIIKLSDVLLETGTGSLKNNTFFNIGGIQNSESVSEYLLIKHYA